MRKDIIVRVQALNHELESLPGVYLQKMDTYEVDLFNKLITDQKLKEKTERLYKDGHHARAVEEAFKYLDNLILQMSHLKDGTGSNLMKKVFSLNNPVLRINSGISTSEQNEQLGYMEIYSGVMTGIRNPRAHDSDWEDSEERAFQLLVLANHLVVKAKTSVRCNSD